MLLRKVTPLLLITGTFAAAQDTSASANLEALKKKLSVLKATAPRRGPLNLLNGRPTVCAIPLTSAPLKPQASIRTTEPRTVTREQPAPLPAPPCGAG